jgi:hypothetical protein
MTLTTIETPPVISLAWALLHSMGGVGLCSAVTLHESEEAAEIALDLLVRKRWDELYFEPFQDDVEEEHVAEDNEYADAQDRLSNESNETFEIVRVALPQVPSTETVIDVDAEIWKSLKNEILTSPRFASMYAAGGNYQDAISDIGQWLRATAP